MPVPEHNDDEENLWGDFGAFAARIRSRLQDGGPPVDEDQLFDLISGDVSESESRTTTERIRTWRSWHEEYWRMRAYIDLANDEEPNDAPSTLNRSKKVHASPVEADDRKLSFPQHPASTAADSKTAPAPTATRSLRKQPFRHFGLLLSMAIVCGLTFWFVKGAFTDQPIVALRDGEKTVELMASGNMRGIATVDPKLSNEIATALKTSRISLAISLPTLFVTGGRTAPVPAIPAPLSTSLLLSPYRTNVAEVTPTFRWKGTSKAISYIVHVYDDSSNLLHSSPSLDKAYWTPTTPLNRGQVYSWDVLVTFDDGSTTLPQDDSPKPAFRILAADDFAEYQEMSERLHESHLALGTYFARQGLLDDARAQFDILQRSNPDCPELRSLADSIREIRE